MNILLIGESCVDEYIYGLCSRICPESAAICFQDNGNKERREGMSSNVRNNIITIDDKTRVDLITNESSHIIKRRFVDTRYNTIVFREDENDYCDSINLDLLSNNDYDAIVISDYCKGFLSRSDIEYISNFYECTTKFIDTKKEIGSYIKNIDFIKINKDEFDSNRNNIPADQSVIVTCGEGGAFHMLNGKVVNYPTEKVEIRDVCGAGDTFLASFVVGYIKTKNVPSSIRQANIDASSVVRRFGVSTP